MWLGWHTRWKKFSDSTRTIQHHCCPSRQQHLVTSLLPTRSNDSASRSSALSATPSTIETFRPLLGLSPIETSAISNHYLSDGDLSDCSRSSKVSSRRPTVNAFLARLGTSPL